MHDYRNRHMGSQCTPSIYASKSPHPLGESAGGGIMHLHLTYNPMSVWPLLFGSVPLYVPMCPRFQPPKAASGLALHPNLIQTDSIPTREEPLGSTGVLAVFAEKVTSGWYICDRCELFVTALCLHPFPALFNV